MSRAFDASHSKIIWLYADFPFCTAHYNATLLALQRSDIIYFTACLFKDVRLGCTGSWRETPLTGLCFDALRC